MRLKSIDISKYRSIANAKLEPCGDFNVLIGRNNSGKSNILASIEAFFDTIKPEVINTKPPIGAEIDFFQRNLKDQIQLTGVLEPTAEEFQQLIADIASERPQVKTLLEEIKPDAELAIRVMFVPTPKICADSEKICVRPKYNAEARRRHTHHFRDQWKGCG
jgi:putative ATP-dependent endonuclease of OLD family